MNTFWTSSAIIYTPIFRIPARMKVISWAKNAECTQFSPPVVQQIWISWQNNSPEFAFDASPTLISAHRLSAPLAKGNFPFIPSSQSRDVSNTRNQFFFPETQTPELEALSHFSFGMGFSPKSSPSAKTDALTPRGGKQNQESFDCLISRFGLNRKLLRFKSPQNQIELRRKPEREVNSGAN